MNLNALVNSGNTDSFTIAKSALNVASETLKMAVSSVGSISKFADSFSNLGEKLQELVGFRVFRLSCRASKASILKRVQLFLVVLPVC